MSPILLQYGMEALKARIEEVVTAHFEGTEYFLVDIKAGQQQKIQVFIDQMSKNISIDVCTKLSRKLEEVLEAEGLVGEKYTLEVSSPGMSNPFKVQQQYLKSLGKSVEILMADGIKMEGVLTKVDDLGIEVEEHLQKKKGQKPDIIPHSLLFSDIKNVKKKITF